MGGANEPATSRALAIPELLEAILILLPGQDIFSSMYNRNTIIAPLAPQEDSFWKA